LKALICGDRKWKKPGPIVRLVRRLLARYGHEDLEIIEGGANGTDIMASYACRVLGVTFHEYPAFWNLYGRSAGPIRNRKMLDKGKPDRVYAFHAHLSKSKGTRNMVEQARKKGIKTIVIEK
jgi:hypothetical protein